MKKTLLTAFLIILSIFLFSCRPLNGDSNESVFDAHLNNYQNIYLERITYFNELANIHVQSAVKVKTYGSQFSTSTGSGVIYKMTDTHYYVLTNQHVINDEFIEKSTYEVFDYQGNIYKADLITHDRSFDLAVLRFEIKEVTLKVATFAKTNPESGAFLATIGTPLSQSNAITFGAAVHYDEIDQLDQLDLIFNFKSLITNIPLRSGNSGGPVFDLEFKIAAIVYGSLQSTTSNTTSPLMLAIPVLTVLEFLELYEADGINI
jgi:S1-C subfamily serine protease